MPDSMSVERAKIFQAYGAECILTPREGGARLLQKCVEDYLAHNKNAWTPNQFGNDANPKTHMDTTALEILNDFPDGVDILVSGLGTGGHISGCSQRLRTEWPELLSFGVEAEESNVFKGDGSFAPHRLMGMGPDIRPGTYWEQYVDDVVKVNSDEAWEFTRRLAREEGILCGITTGANLVAIQTLFEQGRIEPGSTVLTYNYDSGERYLSVPNLFEFKTCKVGGVEFLPAEKKELYLERTQKK